MMTESGSRSLTVTTDDGSKVIYELRGLEDSEIEAWSNFCASIFAYKANPPPAVYFQRHYYNDPDRQASLIRVAFHENQMVASVRVFCRHVSDGKGGSIAAGGIGEVCTDSNHRRRGLSKLLLQDAIEIMATKGMKVSLLHAAPAFFPVYESVGYACTLSEWSVVPIDRSKLETSSSDDNNMNVRLASFPEDTEKLMMLHQQLSESRFCGCIVRSKEYWNTYLSEELRDSLWVYTRDNDIVGWLSLRPRGDRYQLREFGCGSTKVYEILSVLMYHGTKEIQTNQLDLHLPTFVLENLKKSYDASQSSIESFVDWEKAMCENDHGWMYKPLGEQGISMTDLTHDRPHLIWPADSF